MERKDLDKIINSIYRSVGVEPTFKEGYFDIISFSSKVAQKYGISEDNFSSFIKKNLGKSTYDKIYKLLDMRICITCGEVIDLNKSINICNSCADSIYNHISYVLPTLINDGVDYNDKDYFIIEFHFKFNTKQDVIKFHELFKHKIFLNPPKKSDVIDVITKPLVYEDIHSVIYDILTGSEACDLKVYEEFLLSIHASARILDDDSDIEKIYKFLSSEENLEFLKFITGLNMKEDKRKYFCKSYIRLYKLDVFSFSIFKNTNKYSDIIRYVDFCNSLLKFVKYSNNLDHKSFTDFVKYEANETNISK